MKTLTAIAILAVAAVALGGIAVTMAQAGATGDGAAAWPYGTHPYGAKQELLGDADGGDILNRDDPD
jgi:hypothetical protein